jgi:hypothetical protein
MALNDFRCGAQNSVGIGAISDIKARSGGLKSGGGQARGKAEIDL